MSKSFQSAAARAGRGPVEFDVDGETFFAAPVMPTQAVLDVADLAVKESVAERASAISGFLDAVLLPESAVRFAARLRDPERPIGIEDAVAVVNWLIEDVYAMRPTVPSSGFPSGSPTIGSTGPSMGGQPPAV